MRLIANEPRLQLPIRVLQFGTGNFLRGFADWMFQIMNDKLGTDYGVAVVQSIGQDTLLMEQEGQFTVAECGIESKKPFVRYTRVSVVQKAFNAAQHWDQILSVAGASTLQCIVSNTTESGIVFKPERWPQHHPSATFPGKLAQVLFHRFKRLPQEPLAIIPCELIENNGEALRHCVLRYADHWQLGSPFEQYVRERVSFCNTLVDRIVAGLPTDSANHWQQIGYEDRLLTACEPYHLWVLEAPGWVQTALPLAKAGLNVHFVANLEPYRTRKVRILNGAHSMLAPLGYLAGMLTVREAIANPLVAGFVRNALHNEVIPFLPGDAGELQQYAATTIERFGNPAIRHDLLAITLNSVAKYRTRLVPSALAYIKNKQFVPEHIAFAFAALIFFYRGLKAGAQIPIKDDPAIVEYFRQKWEITRYTQPSLENMVTDVMAQNEWWGTDLALFPFFVERIAHHLYLIDQIGVLDAIRELNEDVLA